MMRLYQHIVNLCPDSNDALVMESRIEILKADINLGDDSNVLADFNDLIEDFNDIHSLPRKLADRGDEFFYRKDYPKAIAIWEMVLTKYPGREPNYLAYVLGTSYERLKDYATAIKYYEQSVEKYPNCIHAYRVPYQLGLVYRTLGEYDKAIEWFKQQRMLFPDKEQFVERALMSQAAVLYYELKDYEKAAQIYERFIGDFPNASRIATVHLFLARCHVKLGHEDLAKGVLEDAMVKFGDSERAEAVRNELEELRKGGGK